MLAEFSPRVVFPPCEGLCQRGKHLTVATRHRAVNEILGFNWEKEKKRSFHSPLIDVREKSLLFVDNDYFSTSFFGKSFILPQTLNSIFGLK